VTEARKLQNELIRDLEDQGEKFLVGDKLAFHDLAKRASGEEACAGSG